MMYRTLAAVLVCLFPLNFYAAMLPVLATQGIAEQARACAYVIAYAQKDDADYQAMVNMFLHHAQSPNKYGLTILHCPKKFNFCASDDDDLKVIELALCKAIGGNDNFFEALFYQQSKDGDTPLHYAIRCGNQPWLCSLLNVALSCSNVCDVAVIEGLLLIKNKDDETILDCAVRGKKYYAQTQHEPLYRDMFKMLKKFKYLLLKKSEDLY